MTEPEAPFEEPWQARAFALAVHLHDRGAFSWADWTESLGAEIAHDGCDYWLAWQRTLEKIMQANGVVSREDVARMALLWQEAARTTAHGTPIELSAPAANGNDGMGSPGHMPRQ